MVYISLSKLFPFFDLTSVLREKHKSGRIQMGIRSKIRLLPSHSNN